MKKHNAKIKEARKMKKRNESGSIFDSHDWNERKKKRLNKRLNKIKWTKKKYMSALEEKLETMET